MKGGVGEEGMGFEVELEEKEGGRRQTEREESVKGDKRRMNKIMEATMKK